MNNTIRVATILMLTLFVDVLAMEAVLKYQEHFEHEIETFSITPYKTAHIITFCPINKDQEVSYLDYEINTASKRAHIRMFVCDESDVSLKEFLFIVAEQLIHKNENDIKTISLFANKNDIAFYQRFCASSYISENDDVCVQLACDGSAYEKLCNYYAQKSLKEVGCSRSTCS